MEEYKIKIGSVVPLVGKNGEVNNYKIIDIFLEKYISGYKTVIQASYQYSGAEWVESFYVNDFINRMNEARKSEQKS